MTVMPSGTVTDAGHDDRFGERLLHARYHVRYELTVQAVIRAGLFRVVGALYLDHARLDLNVYIRAFDFSFKLAELALDRYDAVLELYGNVCRNVYMFSAYT